MTIPRPHPDFEDFLHALCDAADFLVVDAYAMAFHGLPRATGDIDVLVRPTPENARRVWQALVEFGAPRIDLLTDITGVSFDEAWSTRVAREIGGRTVHFIGREALARNRRATGRPKDLADLEILEKG